MSVLRHGHVTESPAGANQPVGGSAAGFALAQEPRLDAPVLEAEHLHKEFPVHGGALMGRRRSMHAVEDVSLSLLPGRVTALVGESGSGKTTVARLLSGLDMPTSGTISFRGRSVGGRGGIRTRAYRQQVQLVFQDPFASLNPIHTVRYHLSRPLRVYGQARSATEETARIQALLERVSLTPAEQFMCKYPHELSGGQRQRVAIARALAARPTVLLADEPVSMLDVSIRLEVLNLLLRLKDEDRLAVLYITHDIASARYFADETLVMYAGQVVEGGPSEEVIQRPQHPYTQLLIGAVPDPDRAAGQRASVATRGEPPSLIAPPSGCRFRSRCPYAMAQCGERFPSPTYFTPHHRASCFLYQAKPQLAASHPMPTQQTEVIHDSNA